MGFARLPVKPRSAVVVLLIKGRAYSFSFLMIEVQNMAVRIFIFQKASLAGFPNGAWPLKWLL